MSIDPFTFLAQIFNFAILVWLLRRVLYGPILKAVEAREEAFTERRQELDLLEKSCLLAREELELEKNRFQQRVQEMTQQAQEEVAQSKEQALKKVRKDIGIQEKKWLESVKRNQREILLELRQRASQASFQIANRILQDIGKVEISQEAAVEHFMEEASSLKLAGATVVRSSQRLSKKNQKRLRELLPEVSFEVDPEVLLGLEIVNSGVRYGFSAQAHLDALEAELKEVLEETHIS